MKAMTKALAVAGIAAMANVATAMPTVTIDSVTQRWPWNNKADITYTVANGQDLANGEFYCLKFKTTIGGTEHTIDGVHDVGASMNTGTHTVTWTLPSGVRASDCTIYAEVYEATAPSGDDYMIVDLTDGTISYEGLLATQADSNGRYNQNEYKVSKLVLRKIAKGGTYPVGRNNNPSNTSDQYSPANSARTWTTDRDYYIAIFETTQGQWNNIQGTTYSDTTKPIYGTTWQYVRGAVSPLDAPASGSFLYALNQKTRTGSGFEGFDLPTEIMFEIADRAGNMAKFWFAPDSAWAADSTLAAQYGQVNSGSLAVVGTHDANPIGLYDTLGNVFEWCLDCATASDGDLANAPDPWTPAYTEGVTTRRYRSSGYKVALDANYVRTSNRGNPIERSEVIKTSSTSQSGFRVAYIVK